MYLGKLCKYSKECSVYGGKNTEIEKPLFIIKNVFCNRGQKGWSNCKRFILYEQGQTVNDNITPYD
ncbi:MAG TPA: hypothetical protein VKA10_07910 [Prolixibacteraceae bacterium]|nr:hypothetical protein [Prolixibacteraceae bacterium]